MINDKRWQDANEAEKRSWQAVLNSEEETRNTDLFSRHAPVMRLLEYTENTVVDIGGGPISLLLHFYNRPSCTVVDPIDFDKKWIDNYNTNKIVYVKSMAEDYLVNFCGSKFDEVWMYNCLQHVQDPIFILENLYKLAPVLRISEPCNTPVDLWHPHTFTPEWYYDKLSSISIDGKWEYRMYDYPYVGGVWNLKEF